MNIQSRSKAFAGKGIFGCSFLYEKLSRYLKKYDIVFLLSKVFNFLNKFTIECSGERSISIYRNYREDVTGIHNVV